MNIFLFIIIIFLTISIFGSVDSVSNRCSVIITDDSASIVSPAHYSILTGKSADYTIKPICEVSSVDLFVNYYPSKTDTLARLKGPPFTTQWNYESVPDQDQLHLQFGYVLYHINGDTIISPPQPHHWIIDRKTKKSRKRCTCYQALSSEDFSIDGKLDDWRKYRRSRLASGGDFKCSWTPADFFLAVEIYDNYVTSSDRVEISFDLTRSRSQFFSVYQRIISFYPRGRSFSWAVDVSDSSAVQLDSIIIRINEEMEWRSFLTDYGYIIEARIPFCVLSALEFPQKRFGFDIALINKNSRKIGKPSVFSWSGVEPAGRHNPGEWGTIVLRQYMLPLKFVLISLLIIIFVIIILLLLLMVYKRHEDIYYERLENRNYSPMLCKSLAVIEKKLSKSDLKPEDIARECGYSDEIERLFEKELGAPCKKIIELYRIRKAKAYLRNSEMSIKKIAKAVGFKDMNKFVESFKTLAGIKPEEWKKYRLEDEMDDEEDEDFDNKK